MTIQTANSVSDSIQLAALLHSMSTNNDKRPNNALPIDTNGTILSNSDNTLPEVTLYNAHGILKNTKPNTLIGIA
jgi:hypothetical protein